MIADVYGMTLPLQRGSTSPHKSPDHLPRSGFKFLFIEKSFYKVAAYVESDGNSENKIKTHVAVSFDGGVILLFDELNGGWSFVYDANSRQL